MGVYKILTMKRVNYHLTEKQIKRLQAHAKETGLTVAEIIRRAVDDYFEGKESSKKSKGQRREKVGRG